MGTPSSVDGEEEHVHEKYMRNWLLVVLILMAPACSKDAGSNNDSNDVEDMSDDASGDVHVPADVGDEPDTDVDMGSGDGCIQVALDLAAFRNSYGDDVSIEYSGMLEPAIDGRDRELSLLFERYGDTEYVGTFTLGTGADDNFGTCAHCLFVRGNSPERAYFADRGTLVSNTDPYSRRADFEVRNLRLIEVAVDPFTRESAPLGDGDCIEVADFDVAGTFPIDGWTCPAEQFADNTTCNCECGAYDPDCGGEITCLPGDPGCTPRPALPVADCEATEVCAFEPLTMGTACTESCDWFARDGCTTGTCVFEFGVGDGDVCIADGPRISPDVALGEDCPQNGLQVFCNIVDGFAEGYCGPNYVCRSLCESDDECTADGETCRVFSPLSPLGYCGPEPVDM